MEKYLNADALIDVLNAQGVEDIFINPGGETGPVQTSIAKLRVAGETAPRLVLCLHESVAMAAAMGHYMVSGKPQIVMVHAELGTLQIGGSLQNAQWGRAPVVILAGVLPQGQRVNWKQEPYDQGEMTRNCVKWDHEVQPGENFPEALQKAIRIALTEPRGPVYLCFPFLTFFEEADKAKTSRLAAVSAVPLKKADNRQLTQAAEILLEAQSPLIVAGYSGRYPQSVDTLVELAETLCAPVLTSQLYVNFPTTHPLCAGIEQILGSRKGNRCMEEADAVLVVDYTMPYASAEGLPGKGTKIVHIDVDPSTQGRPLWGRGGDIFIQADSREAIPALIRIINRKMTPEKREVFNRRFKRLESAHNECQSEWRETGIKGARQKPISADWLCHCISRVIDEDTIMVSHTISHQASITEQIPRTKPLTMLGCPAGSINWALGAALGAKVAAPDKTVISLMTDGGFVWGCPVAALWTASTYRASFLAVVFNNQSYGFVKNKIEQNSGIGKFSDRMAFEAGTDLMPPPDYALIAQACGGYGRTLEDPADVLPALKEALKQVRSGKPAVLDVKLERA